MMIYKEYTCIYMVYTFVDIPCIYMYIHGISGPLDIPCIYMNIHEYTTDIGQVPISYVYTMYIHKIGIPDVVLRLPY